MVWGSRLNLTYDFNDTNSGYEIAYDRLYPNTAGHMWDKEGTFYPTVRYQTVITQKVEQQSYREYIM